MTAWRTISVALQADTSRFTSGMNQAARSTQQAMKQVDDSIRGAAKGLQDASGGVKQFSKDAKELGADLTKKVTLPLAAAATVATKMALDFESTFTEMVGLAGVAAHEVDGLRESVMSLASETGRGPQEIAEALNFIRSSGLEGAEALEALDRAAKGAAVGLGSSAVIADALTSAMNAYGPAALSAAEATDVIVGAVREGKGEPEEMATQFGRILPVAAELGVSFDQVGGALAYLTLGSGSASQAATQLSGILQKMLRPSQQGADELLRVGLSGERLREIVANQGLLPALQLLWDRLGQNSEALGNVFEDSRAVTGALALLRNEGREAAKVFDSVAGSAGALDDAFKDWSESDAAAAKQALADLQVAAIQAGSDLAPVLATIASGVGDIASAFSSLPDGAQKTLLVIAGIAAVAGPATTAAGHLAKAYGFLAGQSGRGAQATNSLLRALTSSPGAAGIAVAASTLVIAAWIKIRDRANDAKQAIKDMAAEISSTGDDLEDVFRRRLANSLAGLDGGIKGVGKELGDGLKNLGMDAEELISIIKEGGDAFAQLEYDLNFEANLGDGAFQAIEDLTDLKNAYRDLQRDAARHAELQAELGVATDDTAASTGAAADATAGLTEEQLASMDAAREQARAYEEAEEALSRLVDTILGAFDSEVGYERSVRRTSTALEELVQARKDAANPPEGMTLEEALDNEHEAFDRALDDIRNQADALVGMKVAQAEAAGETLSAAEQNELYRTELFLLASQLAPGEPLRDRIIGLIGDLEGAAQDWEATITVDTDEDSFTRAERGLAHLARDRPTRLVAIWDTVRDERVPLALAEHGKRWGGITAYAAGGIHAHVAKGDVIRYAEPETGGEAFIPRLGDPSRSLGVLSEAAGWYGMQVVPMRLGGVASSSIGRNLLGPVAADATGTVEDQGDEFAEWLSDQKAAVEEWTGDVSTAIEAGYDPGTIAAVLEAGPAEAGPVLQRIAADHASRLRSLSGATRDEVDGLGHAAVQSITTTMAQTHAAADTGARRVAQAVTTALQTGATEVGGIARTYTGNLAGAINPVLQAVGQQPVVWRNQGGPIDGPPVDRDVIPAMLTPGEFVTRKSMVNKWGPDAFAALNDGQVPAGWQIPGYNAGGRVTGNTQGLHPVLLARLATWAAAVGQTYSVGSGYRSIAQQQVLYDRWLRRVPGQAQAAPPGSSMHNFGLASDGNHWSGRNPGAFGLRYPMSFEPWHVEPVEARSLRAGGVSSHGYLFEPPPRPPDFPGHPVGATGAGASRHAYDAAVDWMSSLTFDHAAPDLDPSLGAGGGAGAAAAAGWIRAAMAATGVPERWFTGLMTIARRESNFNPRAVNNWDSNARAGDPSKGLMQTIGATFRANALPGMGDIWNPVHNAVAAIRYILRRYGDISRVQQANPLAPPRGYADGGLVQFGSYDQGGHLPTGLSLAWNGTGRPEPVGHHLTPADRAVQVDVNLAIEARVFIGDREITDIARVEAETVVARDHRRTATLARAGRRFDG